ncbi:polysaccharide deacetylase family protein [Sphaerotilus sp.]|uniref:polysaccharide deacetylase family protein n=1 Tax=Sphaerotilus sp. TaxID=2093942 RepID=UPI0034E2D1A3
MPILMYHRVLTEPDPLQPDVPHQALLAEQFHTLASAFNVLPLHEAAELLRNGGLPPGAACITFDDGYRDNHDLALPLLREYKLPATVFVATGYLNGGRMFNDSVVETVRRLDTGEIDLSRVGLGKRLVSDVSSRRTLISELTKAVKYLDPVERDDFCEDLCRRAGSHLPTDLMMDDKHVKAMSDAGVDIGGHTVNHPILARVDSHVALHEIETNRDHLTALTGRQPLCFAYPNGKPNLDYTAAHARMVTSAGYKAAVSTAVGVASDDADSFQLPRFMPRERSAAQFVARMVRMATHRHRQVAD